MMRADGPTHAQIDSSRAEQGLPPLYADEAPSDDERCGQRISGLYGAETICQRPKGHALPHRETDGIRRSRADAEASERVAAAQAGRREALEAGYAQAAELTELRRRVESVQHMLHSAEREDQLLRPQDVLHALDHGWASGEQEAY